MRAYRKKISDQQVVDKILRTLPQPFDHVAVVIEESKKLDKMEIEELQHSLEAHEMRVNKRKVLQEQALQARSNYKGKGKGRSKDQAQKQGYSSKHSKEWRFEKRKMRCHNGQKLGHYARECRTGEGAKNKPKIHANLAQDEGSNSNCETVMLWATTSSVASNDTSWYLDFGCSTHMTGKREWFISLDASSKNRVCFVDNRSLTAEDTGRVVFRNTDGKETIIEEVLYVPNMKTNLSLGQLLHKGFFMKMADNYLTMLDQMQNLVLQAQLSQNRTFQVRMHCLQHQCLTTLENKEEWLCHLRFCHLNFKNLHLLANHKMVKGLPRVIVPEVVGKVCTRCKETSRNSSRTVPTTATEKLQVIHSDVCGPMQIETPGDSRYFISFIDDLTKKIWVYLLKGKHEVVDAFKRFKCLAEKHNGKMIKVLRTDGGREYVSIEFKEFCVSVGLIHENTPHHSGTAERRNRTLLNLGEAVSTTAYILNRSTTKRLEGITPEEAWTGAKPNVTHQRIFGSVCSRNISGQPTHILVGYHSTGGYKLYEPESGQGSTSRDIICDENGSWTWNASSSKAQLRVPKEEEELTAAPTFNQDPGVTRSLYLKDQELFHDSAVTSEGELVHSALIAEAKPVEFDKAVTEEKWLKAMKEEINSILKNQTWELVDCPSNKKPIALKWVYKVKVNPKGEVVKHKARLVAKGIDYGEVYAPIDRIETVKLVVAITTNADW
ncbi:hypothetical protein CR513_00320, partial [Mucuna pruriens]